jgi:hypothetical protein
VFAPTRKLVFDERLVAMRSPTPPARARSATAASAIFFGDASSPPPSLEVFSSSGGVASGGRSSAGTTTSELQYWHLTSGFSIRSNSSVAAHCGQLKTFISCQHSAVSFQPIPAAKEVS